jgi:hypothetical protein
MLIQNLWDSDRKLASKTRGVSPPSEWGNPASVDGELFNLSSCSDKGQKDSSNYPCHLYKGGRNAFWVTVMFFLKLPCVLIIIIKSELPCIIFLFELMWNYSLLDEISPHCFQNDVLLTFKDFLFLIKTRTFYFYFFLLLFIFLNIYLHVYTLFVPLSSQSLTPHKPQLPGRTCSTPFFSNFVKEKKHKRK